MKTMILTAVIAITINAAFAQTVLSKDEKAQAISVIEQTLLLINEDCNCQIVLQDELDSISFGSEVTGILKKKYNLDSDFYCFQRFPLQKHDFTSKRIRITDYKGIEKVHEKNTHAPTEKIEMIKLLEQCKVIRVHKVSNVCKVGASSYILQVNRGTQNNARMICFYIVEVNKDGKAKIVGREDCNVT